MITKEIALSLSYRQTLYHVSIRNRDGTAARARVNGQVKTWKRKPDAFALPLKHGLKWGVTISTEYIGCNVVENPEQWLLYDPTTLPKELPPSLGLSLDAPWQMVYDKAIEEGKEEEAVEYKAELTRRGLIKDESNDPVAV